MEPQSPTVEELRRAFELARESAPAAEVRAAALAYSRARAEQGATQEQVARELGLHRGTLAKWHQRPQRTQQGRPGGDGPPPPSPVSTEAGDALQREIERLGPRSPSRRFPAELKGRIAEWARGERARGVGFKQLSEQLGVPWESIATWMGRRPGRSGTPPKVSAVRVVSEVAAVTAERTRSPVLRSPAGFVVEGLDVPALAELLRRLG